MYYTCKHIIYVLLYLYKEVHYLRKTFTTTIEEEIQKGFKIACTKNEVKMNDILEAFMRSYINGEFHVETEIKIKRIKK